MTHNSKRSILFVCMGNICRSPTAEGVFSKKVEQENLASVIHIDSAGTHAYHIGEPPDARSQLHAAKRGYDLSTQRARKVVSEDFVRFDYLLAMDHDNFDRLQAVCPPSYQHKLVLFMQFARNSTVEAVPDPYYGGDAGFELVLDYIEDATEGLIKVLKREIMAGTQSNLHEALVHLR